MGLTQPISAAHNSTFSPQIQHDMMGFVEFHLQSSASKIPKPGTLGVRVSCTIFAPGALRSPKLVHNFFKQGEAKS